MNRRTTALTSRSTTVQTARDVAPQAVPSTASTLSTALMVLVLIAVAVLLAACGADDAAAGADDGVVIGGDAGTEVDEAAGTGDAPIGGTWVLVAGEDADGPLPTADAAVTLTISDSQISGDAGCNSYSAGASVVDGTISIDAIAATRMACQPTAVMTQESAFLSALGQVDGISTADDGQLVLTGPDISLRFEAS